MSMDSERLAYLRSCVEVHAYEPKVGELLADRDDLARRLAIELGRNECGQRFPCHAALVTAARRVAKCEGWPDPYPDGIGV